jgi:hypothetical protein
MVDPIVKETRQRLEAFLRQGIPGINTIYIQQMLTFIEESASNIQDHASDGLSPCEGFIAANRTRRRYQDRKRNQWVEVYTTHISCYDLGRGILSALVSVPKYAEDLGALNQEADRCIAALRLAVSPGVTSKVSEFDRGGGLPRMVNIVRSIGDADYDQTHSYRGSLQIISGGSELDVLTRTDRVYHDRLLPGTQLKLRFETIRRTDR